MMFPSHTNALQLTFPSCADAHDQKLQGVIGNWVSDTYVRVTWEKIQYWETGIIKYDFQPFLDTGEEDNLFQGHKIQVLL